jgi:CRISPR-associated protein Cas1
VTGPVSGNVLLRRAQYRASEDAAACVPIVRALVAGKTANSRTVLQRALRDHGDRADTARLENAVAWLANRLRALDGAGSVDELRGIEGEVARTYFDCFNDLITSQREDFAFRERSRRPPLDPVNALLSFLYTLLVHDVRGACESVGLDPQVGFLHRDRPGRPSLALDIMEELRAPVADRLALSLINLRQVSARGFRQDAAGGVTMDDDTRKTVLMAYQKRKQETLEHPFLDETIPIGLVPFAQAQLLSRHLRNDLDGYPPFLWK